MATIIKAAQVAKAYRDALKVEVAALGEPLTLVGFLATDEIPSHTYSAYVARACADVGVRYDERRVAPEALRRALVAANEDEGVHGILVYYPIFGDDRDRDIRELVSPLKDVEGMNRHWLDMLYRDERTLSDGGGKAVLPCTPLAILKLLAASRPTEKPKPFAGATVTVFNRSEVVGRPLAAMLSNDGADVWSFDVHGSVRFRGGLREGVSVSRAEALASSDIVITGVPSRDFVLVRPDEVRAGIIAVNFSAYRNFEDGIRDRAGVFIPRVGPMTVTMALRNTLRLYRNRSALSGDSR